MRMMPAALVVIVASVAVSAQTNERATIAGTYRLVSVERRAADGPALPLRSEHPTGYLIYDLSGLVAAATQESGRSRFAAAQPTPDEALAAVMSYSGYFGTYDVDQRAQTITHHKQGSFDPNGTGTNERDSFVLAGNQLVLTSPSAADGSRSTFTWERMPNRANLTPLERRFLGFRKLVVNEIKNDKGEVLPGPSGGVDAGGTAAFSDQTGYIVYSAAGAMIVHMMQPNRPKYAGARPTGAEAQEILRTYNTYFGTWVVNEADGVVVHERAGSFKPNTIADVPRKSVFEGKRLTLMPPPTTQNGVTRQGYLSWELAPNTGRE